MDPTLQFALALLGVIIASGAGAIFARQRSRALIRDKAEGLSKQTVSDQEVANEGPIRKVVLSDGTEVTFGTRSDLGVAEETPTMEPESTTEEPTKSRYKMFISGYSPDDERLRQMVDTALQDFKPQSPTLFTYDTLSLADLGGLKELHSLKRLDLENVLTRSAVHVNPDVFYLVWNEGEATVVRRGDTQRESETASAEPEKSKK